MDEIKCPHCQKAFKIDDVEYADIVKQVRDAEFDKELDRRLELAEGEKKTAFELVKEQVTNEMQKASSMKDAAILALKTKIDAGKAVHNHDVTEALSNIERERDTLAIKLRQAKKDHDAASEIAKANYESLLQEASAKKDLRIQELESKLNAQKATQKKAVEDAVHAMDKELEGLKSDLEKAKLEKQLSETSLKEKYEALIKDRDHAIERLKDM